MRSLVTAASNPPETSLGLFIVQFVMQVRKLTFCIWLFGSFRTFNTLSLKINYVY